MGRHNVESKKAYRRRHNEKKRQQKTNILTRGNITCNCGFDTTRTVTESSFNISGIETLNTQSNNSLCSPAKILTDKDLSSGEGNKETEKTHSQKTASIDNLPGLAESLKSSNKVTQNKKTAKSKLDQFQTFKKKHFYSDPLYVGMQEYALIKKRKSQIETKGHF